MHVLISCCRRGVWVEVRGFCCLVLVADSFGSLCVLLACFVFFFISVYVVILFCLVHSLVFADLAVLHWFGFVNPYESGSIRSKWLFGQQHFGLIPRSEFKSVETSWLVFLCLIF